MDSVWRYDQYKQDAPDCKECNELWDTLHKRHEEDIALLKKQIAEHAQTGDW